MLESLSLNGKGNRKRETLTSPEKFSFPNGLKRISFEDTERKGLIFKTHVSNSTKTSAEKLIPRITNCKNIHFFLLHNQREQMNSVMIAGYTQHRRIR